MDQWGKKENRVSRVQGMIQLIMEGLKNFRSRVLQRNKEILGKAQEKGRKKKVTPRALASRAKNQMIKTRLKSNLFMIGTNFFLTNHV